MTLIYGQHRRPSIDVCSRRFIVEKREGRHTLHAKSKDEEARLVAIVAQHPARFVVGLYLFKSGAAERAAQKKMEEIRTRHYATRLRMKL